MTQDASHYKVRVKHMHPHNLFDTKSGQCKPDTIMVGNNQKM